MPITDEDDPLMKHATRALEESMRALAQRHGHVTIAFVQDLTEMIAEHRRKTKRILGVDFPHMVIMTVPHRDIVELGRADWEAPQIRTAVLRFVRRHKDTGITPVDVANMVRAAWPHIRPGDLVDESRHVVREDARRAHIDETQPERECDHCHRLYRGSALYCSIECQEAGA